MPSDGFEWVCTGTAQVREISPSPPAPWSAGRCLQGHSPRLLRRNDPSCLSEYSLPWGGLYLGATSQPLQQLSPGAPVASCHLLYESVGTCESSCCSTTCTWQCMWESKYQETDVSVTSGLQRMHVQNQKLKYMKVYLISALTSLPCDNSRVLRQPQA